MQPLDYDLIQTFNGELGQVVKGLVLIAANGHGGIEQVLEALVSIAQDAATDAEEIYHNTSKAEVWRGCEKALERARRKAGVAMYPPADAR